MYHKAVEEIYNLLLEILFFIDITFQFLHTSSAKLHSLGCQDTTTELFIIRIEEAFQQNNTIRYSHVIQILAK